MKRSILLATTFVSTLSSISVFAEDGYYGRFWRGYKNVSLQETHSKICKTLNGVDCFEKLINNWLIPGAPSYAAKDALSAYFPVLTAKSDAAVKGDEIALVLYKSEEAYRKLRNDPNSKEGSQYGPLHWEMFSKEVNSRVSKSLVPLPLDKEKFLSGEEVSVDLFGGKPDWQMNQVLFRIYDSGSDKDFAKTALKYLDTLKEKRSELGLLAHMSLLSNEYFIEYSLVEANASIEKIQSVKLNEGISSEAVAKKIVVVNQDPLLYTPLAYGEVGNLQFEPGKKPGQARYQLLNKQAQ